MRFILRSIPTFHTSPIIINSIIKLNKIIGAHLSITNQWGQQQQQQQHQQMNHVNKTHAIRKIYMRFDLLHCTVHCTHKINTQQERKKKKPTLTRVWFMYQFRLPSNHRPYFFFLMKIVIVICVYVPAWPNVWSTRATFFVFHSYTSFVSVVVLLLVCCLLKSIQIQYFLSSSLRLCVLIFFGVCFLVMKLFVYTNKADKVCYYNSVDY